MRDWKRYTTSDKNCNLKLSREYFPLKYNKIVYRENIGSMKNA